jgi:hypothetical protein
MRHTLLFLSVSAAAVAQTPPMPAPTFAPPVRLQTGGKNLGEARLYPSPVFHDVNGDGGSDIVVGDLRGHLTFALRVADSAPPTFAAEEKVMGADGKIVDLANW